MSDNPYNICYITDAISEKGLTPLVRAARSADFDVTTDISSSISNTTSSIQIDLAYDELLEPGVTVNIGNDWRWNDPRVLISFFTMSLDTEVDIQPEQHTRECVQERVEALLSLIKEFVRVTNPEYVWSMQVAGPQPDKGLRPMDRPISEHLDRLGWVTVLSESLLTDFGGKNHVLNTPAWKVETLETEHVILVKSDNPIDSTHMPSQSPEHHLFNDK